MYCTVHGGRTMKSDRIMQLEMSRLMITQTPNNIIIMFGDVLTPNTPHNFWPHPLGGIIGLFHSVDEIAVCLPYHKSSFS